MNQIVTNYINVKSVPIKIGILNYETINGEEFIYYIEDRNINLNKPEVCVARIKENLDGIINFEQIDSKDKINLLIKEKLIQSMQENKIIQNWYKIGTNLNYYVTQTAKSNLKEKFKLLNFFGKNKKVEAVLTAKSSDTYKINQDMLKKMKENNSNEIYSKYIANIDKEKKTNAEIKSNLLDKEKNSKNKLELDRIKFVIKFLLNKPHQTENLKEVIFEGVSYKISEKQVEEFNKKHQQYMKILNESISEEVPFSIESSLKEFDKELGNDKLSNTNTIINRIHSWLDCEQKNVSGKTTDVTFNSKTYQISFDKKEEYEKLIQEYNNAVNLELENPVDEVILPLVDNKENKSREEITREIQLLIQKPNTKEDLKIINYNKKFIYIKNEDTNKFDNLVSQLEQIDKSLENLLTGSQIYKKFSDQDNMTELEYIDARINEIINEKNTTGKTVEVKINNVAGYKIPKEFLEEFNLLANKKEILSLSQINKNWEFDLKKLEDPEVKENKKIDILKEQIENIKEEISKLINRPNSGKKVRLTSIDGKKVEVALKDKQQFELLKSRYNKLIKKEVDLKVLDDIMDTKKEHADISSLEDITDTKKEHADISSLKDITITEPVKPLILKVIKPTNIRKPKKNNTLKKVASFVLAAITALTISQSGNVNSFNADEITNKVEAAVVSNINVNDIEDNNSFLKEAKQIVNEYQNNYQISNDKNEAQEAVKEQSIISIGQNVKLKDNSLIYSNIYDASYEANGMNAYFDNNEERIISGIGYILPDKTIEFIRYNDSDYQNKVNNLEIMGAKVIGVLLSSKNNISSIEGFRNINDLIIERQNTNVR